jgi:hypothetical protein
MEEKSGPFLVSINCSKGFVDFQQMAYDATFEPQNGRLRSERAVCSGDIVGGIKG